VWLFFRLDGWLFWDGISAGMGISAGEEGVIRSMETITRGSF